MVRETLKGVRAILEILEERDAEKDVDWVSPLQLFGTVVYCFTALIVMIVAFISLCRANAGQLRNVTTDGLSVRVTWMGLLPGLSLKFKEN